MITKGLPPDSGGEVFTIMKTAASRVTHNTSVALAGARHGLDAFPAGALAVIDAQDLGLIALADDLCALRSRTGRSP